MKMKKAILMGLVLAASTFTKLSAQSKYFTRDGNISFYSDAPLEKIEAHNAKAASVLDPATGNIEFSVLMKAFEFQKALMQEHFNENYIESTKFPKAVFKGKVDDISKVNFTKDGSYPVNVSGDLTLHGVTKPVSAPGTIEIKDGKITAKSEFKIKNEDYDIQIPKLVSEKVAKEVRILVDVSYALLDKS
jgi:hypothetical protein